MDAINLLAGINLLLTFGANFGGAKKGFIKASAGIKDKHTGILQHLPSNFSAVILLVFIAGLFQFGTLEYTTQRAGIRTGGLILFIVFSWVQIWSYKSLGKFYSHEVVVFKGHEIVETGPYRFMRHPMYLSQILTDAGAVMLSLSWIAAVLVIAEIPLLILRAKAEEKILDKNLKDQYEEYKVNTGFMFPKFWRKR